MLIKLPIIFFIFSVISLFICKKFNLLIDNKSEKHKKYASNYKSHLLGGPLLISFFYFYVIFFQNNFILLGFLSSIFFIGFFSDIKKINSVSLRFFLQILVIICFAHILNIEIERTNLKYIDELIKVNILNIVFVTFCLTILINGTNFIDGINGLVITYYIIIYLIIHIFFQDFFYNKELISLLIPSLIILLILNLSGHIYLGDSGSYLLSIFTGIFLINFASQNISISPYLIIIFLWYPCFELLFSMIRRFINKSKAYKPDTNHLHQLIYNFIKKKINYKNNLIIHSISSLFINVYNLICFLVCINYIYNSIVLVLILTFNMFIYILVFYLLKNIKY